MTVHKDRVPPTGPATSARFKVTIDHGTVPAQNTKASPAPLPAKSARLGDNVIVNPSAAMPSGLAIASVRVLAADSIEVILANVTTADVNAGSVPYDVLVRRL
ncbi:MAG: hypothetical protein ACOY0T_15830 [Myxococcota bacterium]